MLRQRHVHNYRRFKGRRSSPRRGVLSVHQSTDALCRAIRLRAHRLRLLNSTALLRESHSLRDRVQHEHSLVQLTTCENVTDAFALLTEAMRRATGMTYYDVQLQAGLVLISRSVAEVQTGEGKTITTGLPAYLFALAGRGVHVATTNDYLSKRDADFVTPALRLLGVSVGFTSPNSTPEEKRDAYECDITYGPGYEFGFDFLRDEIAKRNEIRDPLGWELLRKLSGSTTLLPTSIQRGHSVMIVDEVDSVLIDEANMPLILSGPVDYPVDDRAALTDAATLVQALEESNDFLFEDNRLTWSTSGWEKIHTTKPFGAQRTDQLQRPWVKYVENAIHAQFRLKRDVDYVLRNDRIEIVDQQTGRIHAERTWRAGLHQAVETKENVELTLAKETQGRVTRQRYCQAYEHLCGMTGTARGSEDELNSVYQTGVVEIPTNKACQRKTSPLRLFATRSAKHAAIVEEVIARRSPRQRNTGQPILIGTSSVEESKTLSRWLASMGIRHQLLNGVQDETEADIVSKAGNVHAVTVATNMAGRGTDIPLGDLAKAKGGLHVIAAELHESARIDRQLAGRSARQGDPGSYQPFASLEDKLFRENQQEANRILRRCRAAEVSGANEYTINLSREIAAMQAKIQRYRVQERAQMNQQDKWIESVQSALARRA